MDKSVPAEAPPLLDCMYRVDEQKLQILAEQLARPTPVPVREMVDCRLHQMPERISRDTATRARTVVRRAMARFLL
ncbi:hypothetical protein SAMN04488498_1083 [Mesorhizobium albiziae]|uniref:Uncharacterized protein n=1 Tax=Neomesorhizobium albiziae TaxID=335020 RepID=A0A1I4ADI6_9HYPH|nr:hypothetical protein GCM10007937_45140 [Mesorhizobium albiziae]SFK54495.1 hypothetical protein SAMN04488498_1083 [Mesorhizobium albiziae]